jgi:hypothetical protein
MEYILTFGLGSIVGMGVLLFTQGFNNKQEDIPEPETLNDCCLLYEMGYEVVLDNGYVKSVLKAK